MAQTAAVKTAEMPFLAVRVKNYLGKNKVSIAELGRETGFSRETLSRYLNGKYAYSPAAIEKGLTDYLAEKEGVRGLLPEDEIETGAEIEAEIEAEAEETGDSPQAEPEVEAEAEPEETPSENQTEETEAVPEDGRQTEPEAAPENGRQTELDTVPEGADWDGKAEAVKTENGMEESEGLTVNSGTEENEAQESPADIEDKGDKDGNDKSGKGGKGSGDGSPPRRRRTKKSGFFESEDARTVMGICEACREYNEMGIIIGKSGFGKTYALKEYARFTKSVYIECDVTMSTRDLLKSLEKSLGIPRAASSTNYERVSGIIDFLTVNKGYLIIVDEADKLMSRRTQDKLHILRKIYDGTVDDNDRASCGIVIAGEPKLEAQVKTHLEQYAKRIIFGGELKGLSPSEVKGFLNGYEIEDRALTELTDRACNPRTGCFRLLDRTMRNVVRKLEENSEDVITIGIIKQASGLMLL